MTPELLRKLYRAAKPNALARLKASDPELFAWFRAQAGIDQSKPVAAAPKPNRELTWYGRTWDQLRPADRAELKRESPVLYSLMRGE